MRLRLSPLVPADLEVLGDYIAQDSPRQAVRWLRLIRKRIQDIARQPELYRLRPEIGPDARLAVADQYVILFGIRKNIVRIERVLHGSRNLQSLLEEKED
jgi:toxin ParE1/3/4